jgi:hypothetical protein
MASVVRFAGVNGYIKCAPYIADGSIAVRVFYRRAHPGLWLTARSAWQRCTVRVRGFDTTGVPAQEKPGPEGDISVRVADRRRVLHQRQAHGAEMQVVIVAAVMVVDATDGEIMVRTTVPIGLAYANYYSTVDQVPAAANTAYEVTFNGTGSEQGVSLVSSTQLTVTSRAVSDKRQAAGNVIDRVIVYDFRMDRD